MHCNERSHRQILPNKINIKKNKNKKYNVLSRLLQKVLEGSQHWEEGHGLGCPLQVQLPAEGRPFWSVLSWEVKL